MTNLTYFIIYCTD